MCHWKSRGSLSGRTGGRTLRDLGEYLDVFTPERMSDLRCGVCEGRVLSDPGWNTYSYQKHALRICRPCASDIERTLRVMVSLREWFKLQDTAREIRHSVPLVTSQTLQVMAHRGRCARVGVNPDR